jgi:hypothetical protein
VHGDREARVVDIRGWDVHGVPHVDVTVAFPDQTLARARLGRESVPEDLRAGEGVVVDLAMNMIIGIRRPAAGRA